MGVVHPTDFHATVEAYRRKAQAEWPAAFVFSPPTSSLRADDPRPAMLVVCDNERRHVLCILKQETRPQHVASFARATRHRFKRRIDTLVFCGPLDEDHLAALDEAAGPAKAVSIEHWRDIQIDPGATSMRPRVSMASDRAWRPGDQDPLAFATYADALAGLIDNPETATPLTVAISGPWGAGKSSLAAMVQHRLASKPAATGAEPHLTCWFNAWMHDEGEHITAAFTRVIAQTAARSRPLWRRVASPLPSRLCDRRTRFVRRLILTGLVLSGGLIIAGWLALGPGGAFVPEKAVALSKVLEPWPAKLVLLLGASSIVVPRLFKTWDALAEFVQDPAEQAATGAMTEVRDALARVVRQALPDGSRFIVFVDDVERCRGDRAVDLLEHVNQLLDLPSIVIVLMTDADALQAQVEARYENVAKRWYDPDFGRVYVQKIVQVRFDLPPMHDDGRTALADHLRTAPSASAWHRLDRPRRSEVLDRIATVIRIWATMRIAATVFRIIVAAARGGPLLGAGSGPALLAVFMVLGGFVLAALPFLGGLGAVTITTWLTWITGALTIVVGFQIGSAQRRAVLEQARQSLDQTASDAKAQADVAKQVVALLGEEEGTQVRLEVEFFHLTNSSPEVAQAIEEALKLIPPLPRHTKRAVNQARLLIALADGCGVLKTNVRDAGVPAIAVGQWVALQERWPRLARLLAKDPVLAQQVVDGLPRDARKMVIRCVHGEMEELKRFLTDAREMRSAVRQLSTLRPAEAAK